MGALGFSRLKHSVMKIDESSAGRPCEMGVVAATRCGEVLGSQTVLKSDHCPGCQNLNLPDRVEGAPNFRSVPGFPVYGVANPTVDGIRAVIQRISGSRGHRPVLWHNMREEPVIYINGKPFVLREMERPYKNMLEYTVMLFSPPYVSAYLGKFACFLFYFLFFYSFCKSFYQFCSLLLLYYAELGPFNFTI